ncbi:hypothetical protein [Kineococcus rubinsiae]|uniref:hypothetical protein n=1 Tax=Kineococcus rubinsiae TaxID=2609562 RepID=UPI001431A100|nr:hypothetical protein [Kineococcus rubinsiae]NIZ93347.1 hypothetical protein [Kineococcus rubinsiae]
MPTLLLLGLLALFAVPYLRDRRALRRAARVGGLPTLDRPPVAAQSRVPRPWARRRYVETGVEDVAAFLREQDPAR